MSVEYRLPTGTRRAIRDYGNLSLGLDRGSSPRVVGMLTNGFPEGDVFLAALADALRKLWPNTRFRFEQKAAQDQLNIGVKEPLLSSMVAECDAVVIAWGHCGSCTSGVTRDGVAFADRGVPSVTLICDIFWEYSAWLGGAMGLTNLPKVQIPFPMAGTGAANHRLWAEKLAPQVVTLLTESSDSVANKAAS